MAKSLTYQQNFVYKTPMSKNNIKSMTEIQMIAQIRAKQIYTKKCQDEVIKLLNENEDKLENEEFVQKMEEMIYKSLNSISSFMAA